MYIEDRRALSSLVWNYFIISDNKICSMLIYTAAKYLVLAANIYQRQSSGGKYQPRPRRTRFFILAAFRSMAVRVDNHMMAKNLIKPIKTFKTWIEFHLIKKGKCYVVESICNKQKYKHTDTCRKFLLMSSEFVGSIHDQICIRNISLYLMKIIVFYSRVKACK